MQQHIQDIPIPVNLGICGWSTWCSLIKRQKNASPCPHLTIFLFLKPKFRLTLAYRIAKKCRLTHVVSSLFHYVPTHSTIIIFEFENWLLENEPPCIEGCTVPCSPSLKVMHGTVQPSAQGGSFHIHERYVDIWLLLVSFTVWQVWVSRCKETFSGKRTPPAESLMMIWFNLISTLRGEFQNL